jgi:hypothetical protein
MEKKDDSGTNSYRMSCNVKMPAVGSVTNGVHAFNVTGEDYGGYCNPNAQGLDAQNHIHITLDHCVVATLFSINCYESKYYSGIPGQGDVGNIENIWYEYSCTPCSGSVTCKSYTDEASCTSIGCEWSSLKNIVIKISPNTGADYALYASPKTGVYPWPDISRPEECRMDGGGAGLAETCTLYSINPGKYYFLVHHKAGTAYGYNLELKCLKYTPTTQPRGGGGGGRMPLMIDLINIIRGFISRIFG